MSEFKRKFSDVSVLRITTNLQTGSLDAFWRGRQKERQLPVRIERENTQKARGNSIHLRHSNCFN